MEVITLDAKAREAGKKAAKAARKEGNVHVCCTVAEQNLVLLKSLSLVSAT